MEESSISSRMLEVIMGMEDELSAPLNYVEGGGSASKTNWSLVVDNLELKHI